MSSSSSPRAATAITAADKELYGPLVAKVLDHHLNLATENELFEQITAAKLCFIEADRDGSGTLSFSEIGKLCLLMGLKQEQDEEEYMAKMDKNDSGLLDLSEWLDWWLNKVSRSPNPAKQQEVIARHIFKKFDKDRSGYLDASELVLVIQQLGAEFTESEMAQAVKELDTDGSHRIEMQEFVDWWAGRSLSVRGSTSLIGMKLKSLAKKSMQMFSTDIFEAVWRNDYDLVKAFIDGDSRQALSSDTSENGENWMPLHYAAYQGFERIVQLLVDTLDKSQLNILNGPGFTPLFYACQRGHVEVARILLEKGADPSIWTKVDMSGDQAPIVMSPLDYISDYPDLRDLFLGNQKCAKAPESLNVTLLEQSVNLNAKGCIKFNFGNIFSPVRSGKPCIPKELGWVPIKVWHFSLHTSPDVHHLAERGEEEDEQSHNKREKCVVLGPFCGEGNSICCSTHDPLDIDTSNLVECRNPSFAISFWFLSPQFSESGIILTSNKIPVVSIKSSQIAIYSAWSYFCLRIEKNGHMKLEIADGTSHSFKTSSGFPFSGLTITSEKPIARSLWSYAYIVVDTDKKEVSLIIDQVSVGKASFTAEMSDVNKLNSFKSTGLRFGSSSIPEDEKGIYVLNSRPSSTLVSDILVYDKNYYPSPTSRVCKKSVAAKSIIDPNQTHLIKVDLNWLKTLVASSLQNQDIVVTKPVYMSVSAENNMGFVGQQSAKISVTCHDYINALNSKLENMTMALLNSGGEVVALGDENVGNEYNQDEFETLKEDFYGLRATVDSALAADGDKSNMGSGAELDLIDATGGVSAQGSLHSLQSRTSQQSRGSTGSKTGGRSSSSRAKGGTGNLNSSTDEDIHVIPSQPLAPKAPISSSSSSSSSSSKPLSGGRPQRPASAISSRTSLGEKSNSNFLNLEKLNTPKDYKAVSIETPALQKVYPTPSPAANQDPPAAGVKVKKITTKVDKLDIPPHLTAEEQVQYKKLMSSQKSSK